MADLGLILDEMKQESWMSITDPNGNPTDIRFLVASSDNPVYIKAQNRAANKRTEMITRRHGKNARLTIEEIEETRREVFQSAILDWENITLSGNPFPYTADNLKMILSDPRMKFIIEQIETFIDDRANFFVTSN